MILCPPAGTSREYEVGSPLANLSLSDAGHLRNPASAFLHSDKHVDSGCLVFHITPISTPVSTARGAGQQRAPSVSPRSPVGARCSPCKHLPLPSAAPVPVRTAPLASLSPPACPCDPHSSIWVTGGLWSMIVTVEGSRHLSHRSHSLAPTWQCGG